MNVQFLKTPAIYVTVLDLISKQLKLFSYHQTQLTISTFSRAIYLPSPTSALQLTISFYSIQKKKSSHHL